MNQADDGSSGIQAVTVFCSSCDVEGVFFDAADALGRAIAVEKWTLVYGGNNTGPMGALADGARDAGGRVIGVSPKLFGDVVDPQCDEFVVTPGMRERKAEMERRGDAFITLPGGLGTLEEFFEIVVGRHLRTHGKPLVLLNVAGFYDPLVEMIEQGIRTKFVRPQAWETVHVATSVEDAIRYLKRARPVAWRGERKSTPPSR